MKISYANREVSLNILYAGPDQSGKSTNLRSLHSIFSSSQKNKLRDVKSKSATVTYFDYHSGEEVNGYKVVFNLKTLPEADHLTASRKLAAKGVDGIVFVVDSQRSRFEDNIESFYGLRDLLVHQDFDKQKIPFVWQLNKCELTQKFTSSELIDEINRLSEISGIPRIKFGTSIDASAISGNGVAETFRAVSSLTINKIKGS